MTRPYVFLSFVNLLFSFTTLSFAQNLCNGYEALCSRSYSNVIFVGTHGSPFYGDPPLVTENQEGSPTDQLNDGIRYLQAQTHKNPAEKLSVCHTECILEGGGTLENYLTTIKTWLDANPNEMLSLLLTNGDSLDISDFDAAFKNIGLDTYAFPAPTTIAMAEWPSLGDLISVGTRLVVFLDYGADESKVPYILNEFGYYFETPFDWTDSSFNQCSVDRPAGSSADGKMYIVNHLLDVNMFGTGVLIPDRDAAPMTNAAIGDGSIGAQSGLWEGTYGRRPSVVLVD
ncbi:hypothetical protein LTS18_002969 [Coniosporium uncinatum]|uniref:Uncharacterized protein n=1 Tax=Coniosporium uncinatum TaxID=93489 RepID=A0ACC3DTU8_9PEZI|nr:hypothetical protein LTS18_002969 [Coniosporium uncinatum]